MNSYDTHIHRILAEVGNRGLNVRKITLHVYNSVNTLFEPVEKQQVHDYVLKYLSNHVKGRMPLLLRVRHGVYSFNPKSPEARQIKMEIKNGIEQPASPIQEHHPRQLRLFDEIETL
ncbi:MAG: hypothetical protein IKX33_06490 [Prevotella sp.]|nr:hypothetical protein [Prevotella sp.]